MTDRLDRIEALLDRMVQENAQRAAETNQRFAAMDTRLDRIDRQIAENSSAIGELTAQSKTNMLAIGALAETNIELQNSTREMQAQVRQIWERIQEILVELRNRFPGNGRG